MHRIGAADRRIDAAPAWQPALDTLPTEMLVEIVMRIDDTRSLSSFTRVCTRFASLSSLPVLSRAITAVFIDEQCRANERLDWNEHPAHLYRLIRLIAPRLDVPGLERLLARLDMRLEQERREDGTVPEWACRWISHWRLRIAAAISSANEADFSEAVRDHATQMMRSVHWEDPCSLLLADAPYDDDPAHVALMSDALYGIWNAISAWRESANSALSPDMLQWHRDAAVFLLQRATLLPMARMLPLLSSILHADLKPDPIFGEQALAWLLRWASQVRDRQQADLLFGLLALIDDACRADSAPSSYAYCVAPFLEMLPRLPWRENSACGIDWLFKVLDCDALDFMARCFIVGSIPPGIFTDREMAYLRQWSVHGTFLRHMLEKIERPASGLPKAS